MEQQWQSHDRRYEPVGRSLLTYPAVVVLHGGRAGFESAGVSRARVVGAQHDSVRIGEGQVRRMLVDHV